MEKTTVDYLEEAFDLIMENMDSDEDSLQAVKLFSVDLTIALTKLETEYSGRTNIALAQMMLHADEKTLKSLKGILRETPIASEGNFRREL